MRLDEVTVQNYRSITAQTKFKVDNLTTLVGPNNEGKSNLLRAVLLGMQVIQRWSRLRPDAVVGGEVTGVMALSILRANLGRQGAHLGGGYRWGDDYPLEKQASKGARPTVIRLTFRLTEEEVQEFRSLTRMANNGELPIEISLGRTSVKLGVVKPGRGAETHRAKAREIAKFIASRISIVFVPAIRTSGQAVDLANELTRIRMRALLENEEYVRLTSRLDAIRTEAIGEVSRELVTSVRRYIPSVEGIDLQNSGIEQANSIDDVLIHDGTTTSIDNKGDGIKSLVTMALIQELAQEQSQGHSVVLAVDEPEAHLHPASVHELQILFQEISTVQQVILATHNPIFVNRQRVESNILVRSNSAQPAKKVSSIRDALGVELADNLQSAEAVVLVEGVSDEKVLPRLLASVDPRVEAELKMGRLVFKAMRGAGQMRSQIQREKSTMCRIFVVLDDDRAGREEARNIKEANVIPAGDIFLLGGHSQERELEDLIRPDVFLPALSEEFQRSFNEGHFKNRGVKWSRNLENAAKALGVAESGEALQARAKSAVAQAVQQGEGDALRDDVVEHVRALSELILRA